MFGKYSMPWATNLVPLCEVHFFLLILYPYMKGVWYFCVLATFQCGEHSCLSHCCACAPHTKKVMVQISQCSIHRKFSTMRAPCTFHIMIWINHQCFTHRNFSPCMSAPHNSYGTNQSVCCALKIFQPWPLCAHFTYWYESSIIAPCTETFPQRWVLHAQLIWYKPISAQCTENFRT